MMKIIDRESLAATYRRRPTHLVTDVEVSWQESYDDIPGVVGAKRMHLAIPDMMMVDATPDRITLRFINLYRQGVREGRW